MQKKYNKFMVLLCSLLMFFYAGIVSAEDDVVVGAEDDVGQVVIEVDRISGVMLTGISYLYPKGEEIPTKGPVYVDVPVEKGEVFGVHFLYPRKYGEALNLMPIPEVIEMYSVKNGTETFAFAVSKEFDENPDSYQMCSSIKSTLRGYYVCYIKKLFYDLDDMVDDLREFIIRVYGDEYDWEDKEENKGKESLRIEAELPFPEMFFKLEKSKKGGVNDQLIIDNKSDRDIKITAIKSGTYVKVKEAGTGLVLNIPGKGSITLNFKVGDDLEGMKKNKPDVVKFIYEDEGFIKEFKDSGDDVPITKGSVSLFLDDTKAVVIADKRKDALTYLEENGCFKSASFRRYFKKKFRKKNFEDLIDAEVDQIPIKDLFNKRLECMSHKEKSKKESLEESTRLDAPEEF